jgi:hypothetical protein
MEENLLSVTNGNASNAAPYRNLKKGTWGIYRILRTIRRYGL